MARSLNKVCLIGNAGKDAVLSTTPSGQQVTTVSLATTDSWKDQMGNQQSVTEWHRLVFWGNLAQIAATYIRKGKQIYVEGRLKTREWVDKEGTKRQTVEIVVNDMILLSSDQQFGGLSRDAHESNAEFDGMNQFQQPAPVAGNAPRMAPSNMPRMPSSPYQPQNSYGQQANQYNKEAYPAANTQPEFRSQGAQMVQNQRQPAKSYGSSTVFGANRQMPAGQYQNGNAAQPQQGMYGNAMPSASHQNAVPPQQQPAQMPMNSVASSPVNEPISAADDDDIPF